MNPNQGREAAYVKSRVKDLSLITNAPDYIGLFACITPKANAELEDTENVTYLDQNGNPTEDRANDENKVYLPQLVRDVESLDALFGDPRVDPATYKDLLAVRYIVQNGFACYIAKVRSGKNYSSVVSTEGFFDSSFSGSCQYNSQLDSVDFAQLKSDLLDTTLFTTQSSIIGQNTLKLRLIPYKPYSINQVSLEIVFTNKATDLSDEVTIVSTRVSLVSDTRNADLLRSINSYLGGDLVFQLPDDMDDSLYATPYDAYEEKHGYFCIVNTLLYLSGLYNLKDERENDYLVTDNMEPVGLSSLKEQWLNYYNNSDGTVTFCCGVQQMESSELKVTQDAYVRSLQTFNDPKYSGCFISELSSDITNKEEEDKTRYLPRNYQAKDIEFPPQGYQYGTLQDCCANLNENLFREVVRNGQTQYEPMKGVYKKYFESQEQLSDNALYDKSKIYKVKPVAEDWDSQRFYGDGVTVSLISEEDISISGMTAIFRGQWSSTDTTPCAYFMKKNNALTNENLTSTTTDTTQANVVQLTSPQRTECYPVINSSDPRSSFTTTKSLTVSPFYVEVDNSFVLGIDKASATQDNPENDKRVINVLREITQDERRGLHYIIKTIAATRKNLTCVFSTPYCPLTEDNGNLVVDDKNIYDLNRACNWVAARGEFSDLFEYGNSQAVEYSDQAFYCEMYWSWVKWRVAKLVNGLATGSTAVTVPASAFVILNALTSYRSRGSFYPVAGDQGGNLPDSCVVLQNPSTKSQRDKLISYRINPIYDTGVRGVQIYGNETLNPQYTDLSAAHIARTLVQIRAKVDAYTETIKFSLNDIFTWSSWISYVSTKILDPIKSLGGLQWYQVDMGYSTSTREEIAARKIRGMISLQFTPDLEIIDLEFVIQSSALELATE